MLATYVEKVDAGEDEGIDDGKDDVGSVLNVLKGRRGYDGRLVMFQPLGCSWTN